MDQLYVPSLCGEECLAEAAGSTMFNPAAFDGYHAALALCAEGQPPCFSLAEDITENHGNPEETERH